jgi:mono/diheme cytochrome c family protein
VNTNREGKLNIPGWLPAVLVALLIVLAVAMLGVVGLYLNTGSPFNTTYTIQPPPIEIPSDPTSLARGEETAQFLCAGCHGQDMSGQVLSEPVGDERAAPNLTAGCLAIQRGYRDR